MENRFHVDGRRVRVRLKNPVAAPVNAYLLPRSKVRFDRVRADYDEAVGEGDAVRVRQILEANPWMRHEIAHALDGTVPDSADRR